MIRRIAGPGLGDAILTILWNRGVKLSAPASYHRPELYQLMGVDVSVCQDSEPYTAAGHGWPVKVHAIPKTHDKPIVEGEYRTYQFNSSSAFAGAPNLRKFSAEEAEEIKQRYGGRFISLEDRSLSLLDAQNILQHSQGHIGSDSGMAWFALLCGTPLTVWYNGWADPSSFDCNWMHNYLFNDASVRFYR